jgi:hypothetical protein
MSVGVTVNVHAADPCVTASVRPLTVIVPVRGVVLGLAATEKFNHAVPAPVFPLGMVIHDTSLDADQLQDNEVLTRALLAEPAPPTDMVAGDRL